MAKRVQFNDFRNKAPQVLETQGTPPPPEAIVSGGVIEGTLNMLRIFVRPRVGKRVVVVGDYPYLPNIGPDAFVTAVQVSAEAAANAVSGVLNKPVDVEAERIQACMKACVDAVNVKVSRALVNDKGQKVLKVEEHGVIPGDMKDYCPTFDPAFTMPRPDNLPPTEAQQTDAATLAGPGAETRPPAEEAPPDKRPEINLDF